jgi:flagellar hook-associated protein 2
LASITSAGIGSGLDIEGIITKLMAVEAQPLTTYDNKTAAFQAKLTALGKLSTGVSAFQGSLSTLSSSSTFNALSANAADTSVVTPSASSTAVAGSYNVSVTQLAQAQSLNTKGVATTTAMIGSGGSTTLSFQFGTVTSGTFGINGSTVSSAMASAGLANGSLTINGKAIVTDDKTTGAKQLAAAINAQSETTGVTAVAGTTTSAATLFAGFGNVATGLDSTYALNINGIELASQAAGVADGAGITAASLDATLKGTNATTNALAAAKITFTGTAAGNDLKFFAADGSNLTVAETVVGTGVTGGIGNTATANTGSSTVATSALTLTSTDGSPITVAGSNPAAAGLTAGSAGSYTGAGFTQDGAQASGTITLDANSQSLQGIRDAINKAGIGVTASIVSDGSANPYHLVLTSNKTGEVSSMKITVSASDGTTADPALSSLLTYDPAGTQALTQTSAAQSAKLTVNGIAVTSASNSVSGAIQGVSLAVGAVGSTSVVIAKDTSSVKSAVTAFVKAYNDLNTTIAGLTSYNADTKVGAALLGDSGTLAIQTRLRQLLGTSVEGLSGTLTTLSQVGIAFQKDGSLALDSTKLSAAITSNFSDIAGLFSSLGTASDSLVSVSSSGTATKPGTYALNITAVGSQASLTSSSALAATTVIAPNTTWTVTLNQTDPVSSSRIASVPLTAGSYTPSQLSALLRAAINGNSSFSTNGDTVETSLDADNKLTLSSARYGSTTNLDIASQSGTAVSAVFGTSTPVKGVDVAGTLGGLAVTGSGQTLTGAAGSAMEGLKLLINGGATGERGAITFTQGYAYQLSSLASSFIGTDGVITGRAAGLNTSIADVATQRQAFSDKLTDIEARYRKTYTALDVSLASMQSTQTYLTQQLAAIAANT